MADFSFQRPSIHDVATVKARARAIDGSERLFSVLTLTFRNAAGLEDFVDVYFDAESTSRAFDIEHAINQAVAASARQSYMEEV